MSTLSAGELGASGPAEAPQVVGDTRAGLAAELLSGSGIEIGALHLPLALPPGVEVRYVDRMPAKDLRTHYPELAGLDLTRVDVVDDGELLSSIPDESVDFIIANHFLEHCEDPIRTIATHLGKLRAEGVLFYAVPDKRYTFDWQRPRTPLSHVVADHEKGAQCSRSQHYLEWVSLVNPSGAGNVQELPAKAAELQASGYSIHFHVWEQADLLELVLHCRQRFGTFEIEAHRRSGLENIIVLRKQGAPARDDAFPSGQAGDAAPTAAPAQTDPSRAPKPNPQPADPLRSEAAPTRMRIPLSALRERLDSGSAAARWQVDVDGVEGRALVLPVGSALAIPLSLPRPVRFSTRVMLPPRDWRDLQGGLRVWVAVLEEDGARRELWAESLISSAGNGRPEPSTVGCELPASCQSLLLGADELQAHNGEGHVNRSMWIGAELIDESAPRNPAPEHQPAAS